MNWTIQPFDLPAYDEVMALWRRCEGIGLSDADSREAMAAYLERNHGMSFVAMADGKIAGAILSGHDGRRGYIYHLAVDLRWRRQGMARQLVDRCLGELNAAGIRKAHIFIFTENESGKAFWESIGWGYRTDIRVVSKNL
ncbi:MAG: GNAT family N-acetyltransferase [Deltaproteobacteria bacterium]|nr:GNAT family N-acetyltransferase [Deltaproteobacteria bacterium]